MPTASTLIAAKLTVPVSTGQDAIWQIIRDLDKKGPWSIPDIDGETNKAHFDTLVDYVHRLRAGGYVEIVGTLPKIGEMTPTNLYRVKIKTSATPRLRRDGSKAPPSGQLQMWRAMRSLRQFDYRDLARVASTDELVIAEVTAKTYLHRLSDVGFLQLLKPATPGRADPSPAVWRLKPSMNSGPLAPKVMRTHFVFDPNRRIVVGDPSAAENEEQFR
ncbi:hypothetical protein HNR60_001507 [Rhodopseudomonas rhenobacensis]|uniref:Uncharacterized protein n=1 Tax=Rhodopseudomonas rhenobacensis TaxID=87461 RepID=A0A7W8DXZ5_9BRAD|nr:hypothetical protein [Rhodopseudomonas rhenobacensis]MBB5046759.1 hypothetical protein [Rhodopseudomonas rhenobacensis]